MRICNCTLPYTNPEICNHCNNNNMSITTVGIYEEFDGLLEGLNNLLLIDTEKYDIVEKKNAKIKRLENDKELTKKKIEAAKNVIEQYTEVINVNKIKIDEIDEELKKLKS